MCTGLELLAMAAAAGSAIYSGQMQQDAANTNAEIAHRQGEQEKDAAVAQAEKIRKAARLQAGEANAALAASGVAVGEGTALRINEDIYQTSEEDAYSVLLTGNRRQRSANDESSALRAQGDAAATGGYINAGASVLSIGARSSGWKSTSKAPIVERR